MADAGISFPPSPAPSSWDADASMSPVHGPDAPAGTRGPAADDSPATPPVPKPGDSALVGPTNLAPASRTDVPSGRLMSGSSMPLLARLAPPLAFLCTLFEASPAGDPPAPHSTPDAGAAAAPRRPGDPVADQPLTVAPPLNPDTGMPRRSAHLELDAGPSVSLLRVGAAFSDDRRPRASNDSPGGEGPGAPPGSPPASTRESARQADAGPESDAEEPAITRLPDPREDWAQTPPARDLATIRPSPTITRHPALLAAAQEMLSLPQVRARLSHEALGYLRSHYGDAPPSGHQHLADTQNPFSINSTLRTAQAAAQAIETDAFEAFVEGDDDFAFARRAEARLLNEYVDAAMARIHELRRAPK